MAIHVLYPISTLFRDRPIFAETWRFRSKRSPTAMSCNLRIPNSCSSDRMSEEQSGKFNGKVCS